MTSKKPGRPKALDPKTHRYYFKLNDEQNTRLLQMIQEAGMSGQTSRFILSRLFGWAFHVVRIDQTTHDYYARLSSFYHQFIRLGNNYNQIVKAVNTHFSERRLPRQLYELYRATRELHTLCQQIIDLTKDFEKRKEENRHDT